MEQYILMKKERIASNHWPCIFFRAHHGPSGVLIMVPWRLGREVGYIEREIKRSCVENMVMLRFAWWGTFFARTIALKTKATTKHVQTLVKPITTAWIEFFSTIHRFAESPLLSRFFLSKAISRGGRKWVNCCGTCTPFHEGESGHVSWNTKVILHY